MVEITKTFWVPEGSLAGDFRPGFPLEFSAEIEPRGPLDRRGPPRTSILHEKSAPHTNSTTWFLIHDFLTDRGSSIFGVCAAPGGLETFRKGGGQRPPPFWKVSRPPGDASAPKVDDLRSVKKSYIKNLGVVAPGLVCHMGWGPIRGTQKSRQTAFRYPVNFAASQPGDCSGAISQRMVKVTKTFWVPEGSVAGDYRAGFPWNFGRNRPPGPP